MDDSTERLDKLPGARQSRQPAEQSREPALHTPSARGISSEPLSQLLPNEASLDSYQNKPIECTRLNAFDKSSIGSYPTLHQAQNRLGQQRNLCGSLNPRSSYSLTPKYQDVRQAWASAGRHKHRQSRPTRPTLSLQAAGYLQDIKSPSDHLHSLRLRA